MTDALSDLSDQLPEGYMPSALMRILNGSGARAILSTPAEDQGLADNLPFPFLALVGQMEMRVALLLSVINPAVGGVLLIGPRGTGKTTAVRSLGSVLPDVEVSTCPEGCLPEDFERDGPSGVCAECAEKIAQGIPITRLEPVKLMELPLNARLEDVVGGINERIAVQQQRIRLDRGILARADQNLRRKHGGELSGRAAPGQRGKPVHGADVDGIVAGFRGNIDWVDASAVPV